MSLGRAALLPAALVALSLGSHLAGCGNARRGGPPPTPPPGDTTPTPSVPAVEAPPPEPTYGRLVSLTYAAHPELDHSANLSEPQAPEGRWVAQAWGHLWVPRFVSPDKQALIELEIATTYARWEPDRGAVWPEAGPAKGTRIIITDPGPFSLAPVAPGDPTLLAWEVYGHLAWLDGSDVIWCAPSFADLRALAPEGSALRRWLPGLAIGLARQRTGWLAQEHPR